VCPPPTLFLFVPRAELFFDDVVAAIFRDGIAYMPRDGGLPAAPAPPVSCDFGPYGEQTNVNLETLETLKLCNLSSRTGTPLTDICYFVLQPSSFQKAVPTCSTPGHLYWALTGVLSILTIDLVSEFVLNGIALTRLCQTAHTITISRLRRSPRAHIPPRSVLECHVHSVLVCKYGAFHRPLVSRDRATTREKCAVWWCCV
jgi:hypothetical protein